jgi:hypothetical protein
MFRTIISAARVRGLLQDPAVLTAAKWQDWLHPRGKDGRFIEKGAFVNVFASPTAMVGDRTADRRRARISELRPEGAYVAYQDMDGNPLPADAGAGYPDMIPVDDLSTKVSTAPQAIAHLQPGQSAAQEVKDALVPALTQEEYADEIAGLNQAIGQQYPEQAQIVSTGQGPVSSADFTSHVAFISQVNQMATGHGLTMDRAFKDSFGMWSEEMHQMFESMVGEAYDELTVKQSKPRNNRAIMLGGLPGAGKSSTLKEMRKAGMFRDDEWIIANPDYFKDKILEKGYGPKIDGLAPAETAGFIHEASSEMNNMLENLLTAEGYNVIFDITMGSGGMPWVERNIDRLESLEYEIDGMFVAVSPEIARQRSQERHQSGLNALRTGESRSPDDPELTLGGRVVPDAVLRAATIAEDDPDSGNYDSHNARNFDRIKAQFGRWAVWDNSGSAPELVKSSGGQNPPPDKMPGYYPPVSGPSAEAA